MMIVGFAEEFLALAAPFACAIKIFLCFSCNHILSSGGKLFVGRTEELVVDAIGGEARGAQAADKVAQDGTRAAKIDICLGQRGVSLQSVEGDPAGIGFFIRTAFVKRFDQNIAMSGRGFADLGVKGMMRRTACAVDL